MTFCLCVEKLKSSPAVFSEPNAVVFYPDLYLWSQYQDHLALAKMLENYIDGPEIFLSPSATDKAGLGTPGGVFCAKSMLEIFVAYGIPGGHSERFRYVFSVSPQVSRLTFNHPRGITGLSSTSHVTI